MKYSYGVPAWLGAIKVSLVLFGIPALLAAIAAPVLGQQLDLPRPAVQAIAVAIFLLGSIMVLAMLAAASKWNRSKREDSS